MREIWMGIVAGITLLSTLGWHRILHYFSQLQMKKWDGSIKPSQKQNKQQKLVNHLSRCSSYVCWIYDSIDKEAIEFGSIASTNNKKTKTHWNWLYAFVQCTFVWWMATIFQCLLRMEAPHCAEFDFKSGWYDCIAWFGVSLLFSLHLESMCVASLIYSLTFVALFRLFVATIFTVSHFIFYSMDVWMSVCVCLCMPFALSLGDAVFFCFCHMNKDASIVCI